MLRFDTVTLLASYEPPRPTLPLRAWRGTFHPTFDTTGLPQEITLDRGLDLSAPIRFVSSETQGILLKADVDTLMALFEARLPFTLETDLLAPLGSAPVLYTAKFIPDQPPVFSPWEPAGIYYIFDILVRVVPQ